MILETIFTWLGGLLLISAVALLLVYYFNKFLDRWFNSIITVKAIAYHLAYEKLNRQGKKPTEQAKLKLGSTWWTRFRGKNYYWKCIKVEDVNVGEGVA